MNVSVIASAIVSITAVAAAQWPHSWVRSPINGHDYVSTTVVDWHEGEAWAQRIGGHLATVRSQAENDWIFGWMQSTGGSRPWIGASDERVEGTWEWTSGEPFAYSNWGPGEPNDAGDGEDFCEFRVDWNGQWNDKSVTRRGALIEVASPAGVIREGTNHTSCIGPVFADVLRPPVAGDFWFGLRCTGAPPDSIGALMIASSRLPSPIGFLGVYLWVDPAAPLFIGESVTSSSSGTSLLHLPLPSTVQGLEVWVQYAWFLTPECGGWGSLIGSDLLHLIVQ